MWRIRRFSNSGWVDEFQRVESELPQVPSTAAALDLARSVLPTELQYLIRHLESESATRGSAPGETALASGERDSIELWNQAAQNEAFEYNWADSEKIEALEEALAIYPDGSSLKNTDAVPSVMAWHDHTLAIIPITVDNQNILVEYLPGLRDENRIERLRYRYATPDHKLETILDWRGYFGKNSAVIDGWTVMRRQGNGYVASLVGTVGFVVAHVVRRLTRPQPTLERDSSARSRLIQMAEAFPSVASTHPDLSRISPVQMEHAIVFVHGTMSCGIQGLKDLDSLGNEPIYRYEHDTFRPLRENSDELVELIESRIQAKNLLLVAHSRGGLVARLAVDALKRRGYPAWMQVYTFGTPHNGTPLAAMGSEVLNLLYKLSGNIVNGIPLLTPLARAYSFLTNSPVLPPGIAAMHEANEGLATMNAYGDRSIVKCWGSDFKIDGGSTGYGIFVSGTILGAMYGIANDLVVPTGSAVAFGATQPVLECSHSQYFQNNQVQQALSAFRVTTSSATTVGPLVELTTSRRIKD